MAGPTTKSRVSYFYHPTCPLFYYGPSHPMKPHRLKLAHHLILSYGLYKEMECYRPHPASMGEMTQFHSEEYINFLMKVTPDNLRQFSASMSRFNAGDTTDCPVFDGLYEFTQLYTGASLDGAVQLCQGKTDIAINWSGGLHHAKKSEASGFCYVNDIVLAILELLKVHARVLYIDIDVHHGEYTISLPVSALASFQNSLINERALCILWDVKRQVLHLRVFLSGKEMQHYFLACDDSQVILPTIFLVLFEFTGDGVEEAFYTTDRVMTFSVHKYGDFFPGTGHISDVGAKEGAGYSVNVPLNNGITDDSYFEDLFKPILDKIMEIFQPGAIVLQCGADSLAQDRLGCFNLTIKGHAHCVKYVKSYGVPTLVLGGGGYTIRNVARCWAYETATLLDREDIPNDIPFNDYYEYYSPDYELHLGPEPMENQNSKEFVEGIRVDLLQQLQDLRGAPSIAMQQVPPLFERAERDEDQDDPDVRDPAGRTKTGEGSRKQHPSELYDHVD